MKTECTQNYRREWEQAGIGDNFIFGHVMEQNPELCRELVQAILPEIEVGRLEILEREKDIWESYDSHGVRLDVYTSDESHVYEIEMQMENKHNFPKRSRYYSSMIDLNLLDRGEDYNKLQEVFVIIISPYDTFGKGIRKYTFQSRCLEDRDLMLEDGVTKIFLNARGTLGEVSPKIETFFRLMLGNSTDNDFGKQIEEAIRNVKRNRRLRRDYMTYRMALNDAKNAGLEEGRAEGRAEGRDEGALNFLISQIAKKVLREKELSVIVDELESDENEIRPIYEAVLKYGPSLSPDIIREKMSENQAG